MMAAYRDPVLPVIVIIAVVLLDLKNLSTDEVEGPVHAIQEHCFQLLAAALLDNSTIAQVEDLLRNIDDALVVDVVTDSSIGISLFL
jgi:hypothetical protein